MSDISKEQVLSDRLLCTYLIHTHSSSNVLLQTKRKPVDMLCRVSPCISFETIPSTKKHGRSIFSRKYSF